MALASTKVTVSPEEYLHGENSSDVKHEYDNGYVVAMVGASRAHNLIALAVASEMKHHLKGKPCRSYISDMKVRIQTKGNDLFYCLLLGGLKPPASAGSFEHEHVPLEA